MSAHTLFSRAFLVATLERAVRSFAASLASLLTAAGAGIVDVDWSEKFSVAGMAALVTVLFAIGGGTFGRGDGPSFVGGEKLKAPLPAVPAAAEVAPARGTIPAVV
jgi:Putative lactococcus lactis phage r1t holin